MKKLFTLFTALLLTAMLFTGCKNEEKRLATAYTDMFEEGKAYISYSCEFESEGMKIKQTQNIAIDGENCAIDVIMDMPDLLLLNIQAKLILKDKIMYFIDPTQMQVITFDLTEKYDEILKRFEDNPSNMAGIGTSDLTFVKDGNEDFNGEGLYFEEYTTKFGTYKYYFKEKDLVGMSMAVDELAEPLIAVINEVSEEYPKNIFDIPENYTKISAEDAGFEFDIDQLFP